MPATRLFALGHYPKIGRYERRGFTYHPIIPQYAVGGSPYLCCRSCCAPAPVLASQSLGLICPKEAQYSRRGRTVLRTKYKEIVCALPTEYATKIQDLFLNLMENQPYENLKEPLISRTADSESQKLCELLTAEELGDHKLSHLLRRILAGRQSQND